MGVETNTYQIPDLVLSDTFYEWFTVTNNSIIEKLNLMQIYDLGVVSISGQGNVVGDGISAGVDSSGSLFIEIGSTIDKDITFNGNITVNGSTTTINSTNFTVDDYNLILGATTEDISDEEIMDISGNSAGGGIIVTGSSGDKEFLWKYSNAAWNTNQNISFSTDKAILGATDVRIATGASGGNATKGLLFGFTAGTTAGTTGNDTLIRTFNTDINAGHSADVMRITDDGYVHIANGANRITVTQAGHGLTFGNVVRINGSGDYVGAQANSPENAEVIGVVSRVHTPDSFEITTQGEIVGNFTGVNDESSTLLPGAAYFLSTINAGQITGTKPTQNGEIQKTVLVGLGSDRAMVKNYIGGEVSLINQASQALTSNKIYVRIEGGHGFTYGDAVYATASGSYARGVAIPDSTPDDHDSPTDIVGIVEDVAVGGDEEVFSIVMSGKFELAGGDPLTQGDVYFLATSTDVSPNITNTRVITDGLVDKPLFVATGTNTGIVTIQRGIVITAETEDDIITDVPIGAILPFHGTIPPEGYLLCDGEEYDTTVYNQLFALLGTNTTPDLTNRFIVGAGQDSGDYAVGASGGSNEVTLTIEQMPSHNHDNGSSKSNYVRFNEDVDEGEAISNAGSDSVTTHANVFPQGGGQPHENRPPYYALTYIIRAAGVNPLADGTQILGGDIEYLDIEQSDWNYFYHINSGTNNPRWIVGSGGQLASFTETGVNVRNNGTETTPEEFTAVSNSAKYKTYTCEVPLVNIIPDTINPELVRSLDIGIYLDVDAIDAYVYATNGSSDSYTFLGSGQTTNGTSRKVTVSVNPGQSTIKFKVIFRAFTDNNAYNSSTEDGVNIWVQGYRVVRDNTIIRERKAYTDRKNLLINGNFDYWQRGVGLNGSPLSLPTSGNTGEYAADRWIGKINLSSAGSAPTLEQGNFTLSQTLVPNNPKHYINIKNPSSFSFATNGYIGLEQRIEDVRTFAGRNMTVSFWAKANTDGTCFASYSRYYGGSNFDANDNDCSKLGSFSVGTSWKKYKFTVYVPPIPAGKTESTDDNSFPNSFFGIAFYTAVRANARGNDTGADISLGTGNTLSIAQVQVEEGARVTDFERRSPGTELALCQRYYWQDSQMEFYVDGTDGAGRNGNNVGTLFYPQTMRSYPTFTVGYITTTANTEATTIGTNSAMLELDGGALGASDARVKGFKADAEL